MSANSGYDLSAADLMTIINGTYVASDDSRYDDNADVVKGSLSSDELAEVKSKLVGSSSVQTDSSINHLKFSLNPAVNPTYTVSGLSLEDSPNGTKNQTVTFIVSPGLDAALIKPATVKIWLMNCGELGKSGFDESKYADFIADPAKFEGESGVRLVRDFGAESYDETPVSSFTESFKIPDVVANNYYVIAISGLDADKNDFLSDGTYGFIAALSGTPPTVSFTSPSNQAILLSTDEIKFRGNVTTTEVKLDALSLSIEVQDVESGNDLGTMTAESSDGIIEISEPSYDENTGKYSYTWSCNLSDIISLKSEYDNFSAISGSDRIYMYTTTLTAEDTSGNKTPVSRSVTADTKKPEITINSVTPSVSGYTDSNHSNTGTVYLNGKITVAGSINEMNLNNASYTVKVDGETVKKSDGTDDEKYTDVVISSTNFKFEVDTTALTDDKPIDIIITAHDRAKTAEQASTISTSLDGVEGNVGTQSISSLLSEEQGTSFYILQATDRPVISPTNAESSITTLEKIIEAAENPDSLNTNIFTKGGTLNATVSDDDGIKSVVAYIRKLGSTEEFSESLSGKYTSSNSTFSAKLPSSDGDYGEYEIKIVALDTVSTLETSENAAVFAIAIDDGVPTFSSFQPADGGYYKNQFQVTGTITDSSDEITLKVQDSENGTSSAYASGVRLTGTAEGKSLNESDGTWDTITVPSASKNYNLVYVATDKYGQSSTYRIKYVVDKENPVIKKDSNQKELVTIENLSDGYLQTTSPKITIYAKDNDQGSGVATVKASNGTTEVNLAASEADSEKYTMYSGYLSLEEGDNSVVVKVTDQAGNMVESTAVSVNVDTVAPTIENLQVCDESDAEISDSNVLNSAKISAISTGVKIKAALKDTGSGISKVWLSETKASFETIAAANSAYSSASYKTSYGTPVKNSAGTSVSLTVPKSVLVDKQHRYYLYAMDASGRVSVSDAIQFTVDSTPPMIAVNALTSGKTYTENDVSDINSSVSPRTASYTVAGTWIDTISGTDVLQYTTNANPASLTAEGTNPSDSWVTISGTEQAAAVTMSWSNTIDVKESFGNTIAFRAKDLYGNVSVPVENPGAGEKQTQFTGITFDFSVPTIELESYSEKTNSSFTLSGTVSDALKIATSGVTITATKDDVEQTVTPVWSTLTEEKSYKFTINIPASSSDHSYDGKWVFTVNAKDSAATSTVSRNSEAKTASTLIDTTSPTFVGDATVKIDDSTSKTEGIYFNQTNVIDLEIKANDNASGVVNTSGIKTVQYAIASSHNYTNYEAAKNASAIITDWTKLNEEDNNVWESTIKALQKSDEGIYVLFIRATDSVGNYTDSSVIKLIADKTVPELTETDGIDTFVTVNNGKFTLSGSVSDTNLISVTSSATKTNESDTVAELSWTSGQTLWSIEQSVPDDTASHSFTYTITAKDLAGNTKTLTKTVSVDRAAPVVVVSTLNGSPSSTNTSVNTANCKFAGSASDDLSGISSMTGYLLSAEKASGINSSSTESAIEALAISSNAIAVGTGVNGDSAWNTTFTIETDGSYVPVFVLHDNAGNINVYKGTQFTADFAAPSSTLKLANVYELGNSSATELTAENYGDGAENSKWTDGITYYAKENFTLSGTVTDIGFKPEKITLTVNNATKTLVKTNADNSSVTDGTTLSTMNWSYTQTVSADATYTYKLTLEDNSGNKVTKSFIVQADTSAPSVSILAPAAGSNQIENTISLSGSINDGAGIGAASATYEIYKGTINANGEIVGSKVAPTGSEPLTADVDGGNWTASVSGLPESATGNLILVVTAKDYLGNSNISDKRSFYRDNKKPTISSATMSSADENATVIADGAWYNSSSIALAAVASDDDSGLASVTYTVTNGSTIGSETAMTLSGENASGKVVLSEGSNKITFTATDKVGNTETKDLTVKIDTTAPVLSGTKVYKTSDTTNKTAVSISNEAVTIAGTLTEANLSATPLTVTAKKGGTTTDVSSSIAITQPTENGSLWSIAVPSSIGDGSWEFTITATDAAGNSTSVTASVMIDTASPSQLNYSDAIAVAVESKDPSSNWFKNNTLTLRGKYSDGTSGVNMVFYYLVNSESSESKPNALYSLDSNGDYEALSGGGYVTLTGNTGTLSYSLTPSNFKANVDSKANTVYVQAIDKAGNASLIGEVIVNVDQTEPAFASSYYTFDGTSYDVASGTKYANGEKNMTIYGSVSDTASGLESLAFKMNGNSVTPTITYTTADLTSVSSGAGFAALTYGAYDSSKATTYTAWKAVIAKESITSANSGSVRVTATDNAGNAATQQIFALAVDNNSPEIAMASSYSSKLVAKSVKEDGTLNTTVVDSSSVTSINGNTTFGGTATDDYTLTSVSAYWSKTDATTNYSSDENEKIADASSIYSWSFNKVVSALDSENGKLTVLDEESTDGSTQTLYIKIVAKDSAANESVYVYEYTIDPKSDVPTVNIANIANAGGTLKYDTVLTGSVKDDDEISSSCVLKIYEITTSQTSAPTTLAEGWNDFTQPANSLTFNTSNGEWKYTLQDESDGEKTLYFFFTDAAGTSFWTAYSVNTSANKAAINPIFCPNMTFKGSADSDYSSENAVTFRTDSESPVADSVYAVASDSDGVAETDSDGNSVSTMISSSYYAGGTKRQKLVLTINASDSNGVAGMTAVIKDSSGEAKASYTTAATIAGNTIDTTVYDLTNSFTVDSTDSKKASWTLPSISVKDFASGIVTIVITPYDNSGLKGNAQHQFTVDNTAPTVSIVSHKNANSDTSVQYNGIVTLTGSATDTKSVDSVKWYIPTTAERNAWTSYTAEQKNNLLWQGDVSSAAISFTFSGGSLLDGYTANAISSGTDSATNSTYYIIPIYFRAADEFGNIGYETGYAIKFNPDLDKPVTAIEYPTTSTTEGEVTTLGGTIRMNGSATIPDGAQTGLSIKAVYIQIGASSDFGSSDKAKAGTGSGNYGYTVYSGYDLINEIAGTSYSSTSDLTGVNLSKYGFVSASEVDYWWGIKTTTTTWRLNLNENGEMNPTGTDTNKVYLRACAVNSNGKVGSWSGNQYIAINKSAPGMSGKLYQFTTAPSKDNVTTVTTGGNVIGEKDYETGMYIKGQWYIECTATETTAGSKVTIDGVTKDGETLKKETDYFQTADEASSIKVYIPVDKNATDTTVYKVTAIDGSGLYSATDTYTINVDNTAPTINPLYSDYDNKNAIAMTKIENSNYKYDIYSTTKEEGAGLAFMAVYFMRDGKVELPLPSITSTSSAETKVTKGTKYSGTLTQVTSTEPGEVLYGVNGTITASTNEDGTTTTITSSVITSTNSFIRNGSLVKLSGSYYALSNVNTTDHTATVATTFGTAPTTAFFAATIASKTSGEGGSTSGGVTTITKDDGDGFVDPLDKSGSIYTWQLEFFSDELDDGIVDIVVVAADKAGNYSTDTTRVMLTNHKPRVSKVFLATDLNGDETFTEDEFGYTKVSGETTNYAYSALSDDGKEQVSSVLATNKFAVKDGLAVTFEMVGVSDSSSNAARTGGGENLYYITKLLTESSDSPATGATTATLTDMKGTASGKINVTTDAAKVSSTTGLVLTNSNITSATGWASSMENGTSLATQSIVQLTLWDDVNIKASETTEVGTYDTTDSDGNKTFGNQYTIVNIPVYFDMTDDVAPSSEITPFYWNKEKSSGGAAYSSNNSLYFKVTEVGTTDSYDEAVTDEETSTTKYYTYTPMGHIEFATSTASASVSGVIKLEGTVSDDQRLSSIAVTYGGTAVGSATYVPASHTWTGSGAIANGYEMSAKDTAFGQSGHTAKWTLLLDTAKYGNAASKAIVVTATQAKTATATANNSATNDTFTVAAVPYITGVVRLVEDTDGTITIGTKKYKAGTTNRSKLGKYPVTEGEYIQVSGFNFGESGTWTVGSHNTETAYTATQNDTTGEYSFTMTVPGRSGSLTVKDGTNSITSLNNSNDNTKNSNKETYQMSGNSTQYTSSDDRYLSVWNMGNYFKNTLKSNSDEFEYPVMTAKPNGELLASWGTPSNGSITFSYGLGEDSTAIYNAYDQPGSYTSVAFDQKGDSEAASVMFMAELQGNGGTYSVTGLSSSAVVGGAAVTQIGKDDISNKKVYTGKKSVVTGNPSMYLDGDNTTGFYNLANYDAIRRLGVFESPKAARYGNYLHNIWYDSLNENLKYSVVNLDETVNDQALTAAYNDNTAAFAGWVVIDGNYTQQDRVFEWTTNTTGANKNNKVGGADNKHGTQTGVGSTYYPSVFNKVIFLGSNANKDQTKTTYIGTTTKTTLVMNGAAYANAPAAGDTIALMQNTQGAYKIVLSRITNFANNTNTITWADALPDGFTIHSAAIYQGNMNIVGGNAVRNYADFTRSTANNLTNSTSAGSSASIDVDSTGKPVIAYYDATNSSLRVAYATNVNPKLARQWERVNTGMTCSGEVSLKVDGANNLHIMYNNGDGNMCYVFGEKGETDGSYTWSDEEVIDDTGSLAYGSISVVYNGTSYVPTMTWLNKANTANSVKYARRTQAVTTDTASSKGSWDFMIIPALGTGHYALKECKISIESSNNWTDTTASVLQHQLSGANAYYKNTATPALVDSVLAYKTSNAYETAYLKKE